MELHFIINEKSGNGNGKNIWSEFKKHLTTPFIEHFTQYSGHALEILKAIAVQSEEQKVFRLVIAVGGDGTIHEVVNGAVNNSFLYIGFIKAGSGNDFSRAYPTFQTAFDIERFLKKPNGTKMDCGKVSLNNGIERKFVNNAGIGFDAFVVMKSNSSKSKGLLNKLYLGKLSYAINVFVSLFRFKRFHVEVEIDGKQYDFQKVWFVTVSNQPYFGGGMKISPHSIPNDGQMEMTIVHDLARMKLLLLFGSVFIGAHTKLKEVTQLQGDYFKINLTEPLYCHADGEIIGTTESYFSTITYQVEKESWKSVNLK